MAKKKLASPAKKKATAKRREAKKDATVPPAPPADTPPPGLPERIAELDLELLNLVQRRAKLSEQLTQKTKRAGAGKLLPNLEQAIEPVLARSRGPLPRRSVRAIFREVVGGCQSLVRQLRIAFLGPLYSYSHLAALERFGQSVEFVPVGTIAAVFEEVNRGHAEFGLVPVENSTDGRIADTLDMFTRLPLRISAQIEMQIHHTLLGKCPRGEVTEVYSRPQALSQCRNWLAKHVPGARTIEVTSTSTAAQLAREKPGAAAIASWQAGVHYELDVLAERIEDNLGNRTRFAIIGGEAPAPTGNDCTALLFQVEHRPGGLAEAMNIFKRNRVNLTWIESFPVPGSDRAYLFFVEMEGHQTDEPLKQTIAALKKDALRLEILGSFPAPLVVE
jgi:chorismate mutase / prephenate dehydratase